MKPLSKSVTRKIEALEPKTTDLISLRPQGDDTVVKYRVERGFLQVTLSRRGAELDRKIFATGSDT